MTFFAAVGVEKIEGAVIDPEEEITPHVVSRADLRAWLRARERDGMLIDYKIFAALYLAEWEPVT